MGRFPNAQRFGRISQEFSVFFLSNSASTSDKMCSKITPSTRIFENSSINQYIALDIYQLIYINSFYPIGSHIKCLKLLRARAISSRTATRWSKISSRAARRWSAIPSRTARRWSEISSRAAFGVLSLRAAIQSKKRSRAMPRAFWDLYDLSIIRTEGWEDRFLRRRRRGADCRCFRCFRYFHYWRRCYCRFRRRFRCHCPRGYSCHIR